MMSGPILANPSIAQLPDEPEMAAPVAAPQAGRSGRQRDIGLAAFLAVSAAAGLLSAWVCFGSALSSLAPGTTLGAADPGHRQNAAPPASAPASLVSVVPSAPAAGSPPSTQAPQPRQSAPAAAAAVLAGGVASGPGPGGSNIASEPPREASAERVLGDVGEVRDAASWVVGGQIVHLWGIRPDPAIAARAVADFAARVAAAGPLGCRRQRYSRRYRCLTTTGQDLAELALAAGIGRAARGAPLAYRRAQARTTAAPR